MLLTDLLKINPLHFFLPPKAVPKSNYRVTLLLRNIQEIIRTEIMKKDEDLLSLRITVEKDEIYLTGEYQMTWLFLARWCAIRSIFFRVRLRPGRVSHNKAECRIVGYRVWDTSPSYIDFVRLVGKWEPFHKKRLLHSIVSSFPKVLSLSGLQWEVLIDLNYFLDQVPSIAGSMAGSIEVTQLLTDGDNLLFSVKSSTLLKPLMDFFGPEYLSIEFNDEHGDVQQLLIKKF